MTFCAGNVEHVLLHVHLAPDRVDEGHDEMQAGRQGARVAAEPLDGPVGALRHGLHAREHQHQRHEHQRHDEDQSATLQSPPGVAGSLAQAVADYGAEVRYSAARSGSGAAGESLAGSDDAAACRVASQRSRKPSIQRSSGGS